MFIKKIFILIFLSLFFSSCSIGNLKLPFFKKKLSPTEKYFEKSKESQPELIAFLRKMPKGADLHNHVTGAVYSDYIIDYAQNNNMNYNSSSKLFEKNNLDTHKKISSENSKLFPPVEFIKSYLSEILDNLSMRGARGDKNGHDHFFDTFKYISSAEPPANDIIKNMAYRNLYENVNYLELMVQSIPKSIREKYQSALKLDDNFDLKNLQNYYYLLNDLNSPDNLELLKRNLDEREHYLNSNGIVIGKDETITIRYIQQLKRASSSLEEFFIDAYCAIYFDIHEERIVGINMVQAEDHPYSRNSFKEQMEILNFLYNQFKKDYKDADINISLHAGELVLKESPVEAMQNRISNSLYLSTNPSDYDKNKDGNYDSPITKRIGHGISIAWEENFYTLIKGMAKYKTAVEICLSSNEAILDVKDNDHPFLLYKKAGIPMCISTDDEGVNRSNLSFEYVKAVSRYNLSYEELKNLIRNTLEYSFLEGESLFLKGDYKSIRKDFKKFKTISQWKNAFEYSELIKNNPKLKKQIQLEIEFLEFEKFISLINKLN